MSQISWEGLHCTWRQAEAIGKSCVCFATRAPCHDVLPCFASLEVFQLISIVDLKAKVCHVLYVTISDIYQLFWPFWVLEHMHCLGMCPNVFLKAEVLRWTKHAHNFKGQPCALPPSVVILTWSRFSAKPEPTKTGPTSGVLLLCLMLAALVILKLPDCCAKHEQMNLGVGSMVSTLVLICNRDMWYERIASRFGCQNSLVDSRSAMYLFFFCMFSCEICWWFAALRWIRLTLKVRRLCHFVMSNSDVYGLTDLMLSIRQRFLVDRWIWWHSQTLKSIRHKPV